MKNRKQVKSSSNDNAPLGVLVEDMAALGANSHLYVGNAPCLPAPGVSTRKVPSPLIITTNLPESLPILPQEIALIRGFMGDLVSRILANDNEPT